MAPPLLCIELDGSSLSFPLAPSLPCTGALMSTAASTTMFAGGQSRDRDHGERERARDRED